ncbi:hypothetical protein PGB90_004627 [Kerria lacca]
MFPLERRERGRGVHPLWLNCTTIEENKRFGNGRSENSCFSIAKFGVFQVKQKHQCNDEMKPAATRIRLRVQAVSIPSGDHSDQQNSVEPSEFQRRTNKSNCVKPR